MGEPKKMKISCSGCGKENEITVGQGHTAILQCSCGSTTYAQGEPDLLKELNRLVSQAPAILKQMKEAKRKGFESGIDEALHEVTKAVAAEILREDAELRDALKEHVLSTLQNALFGSEEGNVS